MTTSEIKKSISEKQTEALKLSLELIKKYGEIPYNNPNAFTTINKIRDLDFEIFLLKEELKTK